MQRHTVCAYLPDEMCLFQACSSTSLAKDPLPEPASWGPIASGRERLRAGLGAIYAWYARNAGLAACMLRDAEHHAPTNAIVEQRMAPAMCACHGVLGTGRAARQRAVLGLALGYQRAGGAQWWKSVRIEVSFSFTRRLPHMLLRSLSVPRAEFEAGTGWLLKPQGACRGEVCIPLSQPAGEPVDVARVARDIGMPLVAEPAHGLWALGPASMGSRALASAEAPDLCLPDLEGRPFRLSSLRGRKVLLYAWAPY